MYKDAFVCFPIFSIFSPSETFEVSKGLLRHFLMCYFYFIVRGTYHLSKSFLVLGNFGNWRHSSLDMDNYQAHITLCVFFTLHWLISTVQMKRTCNANNSRCILHLFFFYIFIFLYFLLKSDIFRAYTNIMYFLFQIFI